MNRAFLWPAALLALAAACAVAPAQNVSTGGAAGPPAAGADMQEDIEIMRRLLDGAFAEVYGFHAQKALPLTIFSATPYDGAYQVESKQAWTGTPVHPAPHVEGVYLKDYGVVYTVTLPPTGFDPMPGSHRSAGDKVPPDDWDRIRKEIHGETPTPENKVLPAHQPLSEVILKVLADNGKHFGALADGERISVAVTFRGAANCTNCHQNPGKGGQPYYPLTTWQNLPDGWYAYATKSGSGGSASPTGTAPADTGAPTQAAETPSYVTDARNAILLGDLHMKQGRTKEAMDAYLKALKLLGDALAQHQKTELGLTKEDVPALLTSVDMCNKLAAAFAQVGNVDAASNMLKKGGDLAKQAEKLTGGTTTAPAPAAPGTAAQALPPKLVVTASKKQLDDVGSGKLTFEAFCKAATVEFVNAPGDKK